MVDVIYSDDEFQRFYDILLKYGIDVAIQSLRKE